MIGLIYVMVKAFTYLHVHLQLYMYCTVEPLIKDTLLQGTLTFRVAFWYFIMLNDPSTKDISTKKDRFAGPKCVRLYRDIPLHHDLIANLNE